MKVILKRIAVIFFICLSMNVIAQAFPENKENDQIQKTDINQYRGFTAKEILNFHKKLEEESLLWLEGRGDLARYAFLHLTEFQEHSILNKGKNITPLPEFPRAEVEHELEYYNISGYFTSVKWLQPDKFQSIFMRLLKEALGVLPPSDEVIVIGSVEELEEKVQALLSPSTRHLFKVDGSWQTANNFVAQLETQNNTILGFRFRDKLIWEFPKPSFSGFLAQLFTEMTNVEIYYDEAVKHQKKGHLVFFDGEELGILLKWIEIETSSTKSDEVESIQIVEPMVAELYAKDRQIGYFVYMQEELVYTTDKTKETFNVFNGYQVQNSLGVERIHRIEGMLYDSPIFVEYNENQGIIDVRSGDE